MRMRINDFEPIEAPVADAHDGSNTWSTAGEHHSKGEAGFRHSNNTGAMADVSAKFNQLPPGMVNTDQAFKRINPMPLVAPGISDPSGKINYANPDYLVDGYNRLNSTLDEQGSTLYTGTVQDDLGNTSFVPRNNYRDRSA